MQKLIAEKNRQRTISTGSLDGTVITRDNKLIKDPEDLRNTVLKTMALERLEEETPEDLHNNGSEPNIAVASSDGLGNGNLGSSKMEDVSAAVQPHSVKSLDYMATSSDSSKFVSRVRSESSVSQGGSNRRVRTVSTGSEGAPLSSEWKKGEAGSKGSQTILAPPKKVRKFLKGVLNSKTVKS